MASYSDGQCGRRCNSNPASADGLPTTSKVGASRAKPSIKLKACRHTKRFTQPAPGSGSMGNPPGFKTVSQAGVGLGG
jgi:hypothetical protein